MAADLGFEVGSFFWSASALLKDATMMRHKKQESRVESTQSSLQGDRVKTAMEQMNNIHTIPRQRKIDNETLGSPVIPECTKERMEGAADFEVLAKKLQHADEPRAACMKIEAEVCNENVSNALKQTKGGHTCPDINDLLLPGGALLMDRFAMDITAASGNDALYTECQRLTRTFVGQLLVHRRNVSVRVECDRCDKLERELQQVREMRASSSSGELQSKLDGLAESKRHSDETIKALTEQLGDMMKERDELQLEAIRERIAETKKEEADMAGTTLQCHELRGQKEVCPPRPTSSTDDDGQYEDATKLQQRDAEVAELREELNRERELLSRATARHEDVVESLRADIARREDEMSVKMVLCARVESERDQFQREVERLRAQLDALQDVDDSGKGTALDDSSFVEIIGDDSERGTVERADNLSFSDDRDDAPVDSCKGSSDSFSRAVMEGGDGSFPFDISRNLPELRKRLEREGKEFTPWEGINMSWEAIKNIFPLVMDWVAEEKKNGRPNRRRKHFQASFLAILSFFITFGIGSVPAAFAMTSDEYAKVIKTIDTIAREIESSGCSFTVYESPRSLAAAAKDIARSIGNLFKNKKAQGVDSSSQILYGRIYFRVGKVGEEGD